MNKKTKRLFSLLLALVMILTAIPITAIPTMAESASPTLSKFGVLKSHGGEWDDRLDEGNKISNVIWDSHGSGNQKYSIAFWVYDISSIPQYADITTGSVDARVEAYTANTLNQSGKSLEYYWLPQTYKDDTFVTSSTSAGGTEYTDSSFSLIGGNISNINTFRDKFLERYSEAEMMFSLDQTTAPRTETKDIKSALQKAVNNGDQQFIVAAIHNTYFDTALPDGSDKLWSDTKVKPPEMTVDYTPVTVNTSDLTIDDWGVCKKKDGQYDDRLDPTAGTTNIIWDDRGNDSNGSVAFWVYDLSSFSGKSVKSSTISVNVSAYEVTNKTDKYVDFYWIPYSFITDDYVSHAMSEADQEYCPSTFFSGNISNLATDFTSRYTGATKIYSVQHTTTGDAPSATITDAISSAVANGDQQFILAGIQRASFSSSDGWSDSKFKKPTISVSYAQAPGTPDYNSTTINTVNNENSVTGRVTVGDVIYTSADTESKNYGTFINKTQPYNTPITVNSGTLDRIELVDANAKRLTTTTVVNEVVLDHQNIDLDKFKAQNNTNVTATLRFVFTDGKIEYHRVAVKSVPVEAHIALSAQQNIWGGFHETSFETTFKGSYGSVQYVDKRTGNWQYHNAIPNYDTTLDRANEHMNQNDKIAGFGDFAESATCPTNTPPVARYYIDKSNTNLANGNCYNSSTGRYTIEIPIIRWFRGSRTTTGTAELTDLASLSGLSLPAFKNSETSGETFTATFTGNSSVNTNASADNFNLFIKNCDQHIEPKAKLVVNLFDKSATRNVYNAAIEKYNNENNYVASKYDDFLNAILDAEGYLTNFENTNDTTTNYTTKMNNATAELDKPEGKRGNVQDIINACNTALQKTTDTQYTQSSRNQLKNTLENDLTYVSKSGDSITSKYTGDVREFSQAMVNSDINRINAAVGLLVANANFTAFDEAYNNADTLLRGLDNQDAVYTEGSVNALITAINNSGFVATMNRTDTPANVWQTTITNNANAIKTAYDNLVAPSVSLEAYNAEITNINNIICDRDVTNLTVDELTTLETNLNNSVYAPDITTYGGVTIKVYKDGTNQDTVDAAITDVEQSINAGKVTYTLTATNATTPTGSPVAYGTRVTFTATDSNEDTAWYMTYTSTTTNRTKQYQGAGATYSVNVFGNINIEAHSRTDANPYKVTIIRKYSGTSQEPGIELIDFVNGSYTLPQPSTVAGFTFKNYTVNGETKNVNDPITITKDTSITANYQYDGTKYTVTIGGTDTNYNYNDKIELNAADGKVWLQNIAAENQPAKYRMFYNGSTTTLFVVGNLKLISVERADLSKYNILEEPISLLNTSVADNKLVFNGQVAAPEGTTVKEFGVLIGKSIKDGYTLTENDVTVENSGKNENFKVMRCKVTKTYGADQFTIRLNGLADETGILYKGYIIYEDNTSHQLTTVYTDTVGYSCN